MNEVVKVHAVAVDGSDHGGAGGGIMKMTVTVLMRTMMMLAKTKMKMML